MKKQPMPDVSKSHREIAQDSIRVRRFAPGIFLEVGGRFANVSGGAARHLVKTFT
jgi:hypothetical protein